MVGNNEEERSWADIGQIPTDPADVSRVYDAFAGNYEETVTRWRYEGPQEVARFFERFVPKIGAVLDAGCGTGLSGLALHKAGYGEIYGLDVSAQSVVKARETGAYQRVLVHDLNERFPFGDDEFVGLGCAGVLSYFVDLLPVLREFCRVVRPGQYIIFTHRQDLYRHHNHAEQFAQLEAERVWERVFLSPPMPYMPGHADYGDDIRVHYFVYRVML